MNIFILLYGEGGYKDRMCFFNCHITDKHLASDQQNSNKTLRRHMEK